MNENKNSSSQQEIEDSLKGSRQIYRYGKYGKKWLQNHLSKATFKTSAEVGRKAMSAFSSFLTNPKAVLISFLIVIIILCIFVPVALSNVKDSDNRSIYESEEAYQNMMPYAIQITEEAIQESYEKTKNKMEQEALEYIDTNYKGYEDYIYITYTMDDITTTSANITGYIQAVNGVLMNYLPVNEDGNHKSGLSIENGLIVEDENEYNSLGEDYKKCVQEYAQSNPLFSSKITEDIQKTEVEEMLKDEDGNTILDEFGHEQYETKAVYAGDIYVDVTYDISKYKETDIEKASEVYYSQVRDSVSNKQVCLSQIKSAIYEMLYLLTGSKTIPSSHTYSNRNWDMISGIGNFNAIDSFDRTTSEGWTLPIKDASRSAGTWNYLGGGKHLGYDFAASEGCEIVAIANGVVLVSADGCTYGGLGSTCAGTGGSTGGGNQIYLLVSVQDKLYAVKYLHMQYGSPIAQGTQVKAGEHIGLVGSTGNSSGAHCHIEIFYLGDASDFQNYLSEWNGDLSFGCGWVGSYDGYGKRCDAGYEAPCRIRPETIFGE